MNRSNLPWAIGLALLGLLAGGPAAVADDRRLVRSLTGNLATDGIQRLELRLPVASIRIEASSDDHVRIDLGLRCSFDNERCEEQAEELSLRSSREGNTLRVGVDGMPSMGGLRIKVKGRILVPKGMAVDVNLPVGELTIRDVTGDLDVDVGVGEVGIMLREHDVRSVRMGVGIGEATLSVAGRHIEGSGWLGQKVRWGEGTGPSRVAISLGVGELGVKLD